LVVLDRISVEEYLLFYSLVRYSQENSKYA
jgi:hypothetical protein